MPRLVFTFRYKAALTPIRQLAARELFKAGAEVKLLRGAQPHTPFVLTSYAIATWRAGRVGFIFHEGSYALLLRCDRKLHPHP